MYKKLKEKFSNDFYQNVIRLASGTAIAQLIAIAISPILTRIYSPADFGLLGIFISFISILSVVSTGRLELAILIPKEDESAIKVVCSTFIYLLVFSMLLMVFFCLDTYIVEHFFRGEYLILCLLFIGVLLRSINGILYYWHNRKANYTNLSQNVVINSGTKSVFQTILGFCGFTSIGLVTGSVFGFLLANIFFVKKTKSIKKWKFSSVQFYETLGRYKKFILYLTPAHLLNAASLHLPLILIAIWFSDSFAGQFALAQRIIFLPIGIIAGSIGDVFRQKAIDNIHEKGNCQLLFQDTAKTLAYIAIIPTIIILISSTWVFPVVFGEEWVDAGQIAQLLAILFFFQLIGKPLSSMFIIREEQKMDFIWQILFFVLSIGSLFIGYYNKDVFMAISLFAIGRSIAYIIGIGLSYKIAKYSDVS